LAFPKYIDFTTYLDIVYIYIHRKYYVARKTNISYNLEWREQLPVFPGELLNDNATQGHVYMMHLIYLA